MNILLTSVGRRSYLVDYFRNALEGRGKVFVSNSDKNSPAFDKADNSVVSPLIYSSEYIPFLLNYCTKNKVEVIIPLFDVDVFVLAQNKPLFFENGIRILVADWRNIDFCNDKYATFMKLGENGFSVPFTVNSLVEAKNMLAKNMLQFPLIVKPRWGMGSIGIYEADNYDELEIFYHKTMRDVQESYLKYESSVDIQKSVIIQQKIKAVEYGLDVINNLDGKYQTTIVKIKNSMRAGETDSATVIKSPDLEIIGEKLANIVRHPGNLDVDILFDGDTYFVLELNARFGGGYPFSHLAGANLPKAITKWLFGEKLTDELSVNFNVSGYKDITIKRFFDKE